MKRLALIGTLVVAVLAVLVLGTGAKQDDGDYKVRAIFDNAGFLVPGEDVKASGVVIGRIDSLDVTSGKKAAVVLKITDPAFKDFRQDARCQIRLQSLLGEKYVACEITAPKNADQPPAPPLRKIRSGPGKGQYLLPLSHNSSPVDLDMLNDIMRLPERQRLAIIINEFGTGLAGNGDELRKVIRRANPAFDQFDRFLKILADQNRVIARLAVDSDIDLAPLARERRSITNFIAQAGKTATATAERGDDLERNFALFPRFLRELRPFMRQLGTFSDQATPVLADLGAAAPSINKIFEQLGPFSTAAVPTFRTLGDAAEISRRALIAARPVIADLGEFARASGPLARDLAGGLGSLEREHGIDRFMQTVFGFTGALNGYDSVSHYMRAFAVLQAPCFNYSTTALGSCDGRFGPALDAGSAASASAAQSQETGSPASDGTSTSTASRTDALRLPTVTLPSSAPQDSSAADDAQAGAIGGGDAAAQDPAAGVLGYLLGSEAVR